MKKWAFVIAVAAICLYFCLPEYDYSLKGKYQSAPDGTVLYLTSYVTHNMDSMFLPVDSAVVEDGEFSMKGNLDEEMVCFISSGAVVDGGFFLLEKGKMNIFFDNGVKAFGSEKNEELGRFMHEKQKLVGLRMMASPTGLESLALEPSMCDSVKELAEFAGEVFDAYAVKLIDENIGGALGHFYLTQSVGVVSPEKLVNFFLQVPERFRDRIYDGCKSRVENLLLDEISAAEYTNEAAIVAAATSVGKKFKDFELPSIDGGNVSLLKEVASGKYTLLAFWAGWNAASCNGMKKASALYGKYASKGLSLLSVSLDSSVEECRDAVGIHALKGKFLCSPEGRAAEVASLYGISSLPVFIVINNNGTIIARTASVDDIEKKLKEVL